MFISGYSMTLLVFGSIEVFKLFSHCSIVQLNESDFVVGSVNSGFNLHFNWTTISNLHHFA